MLKHRGRNACLRTNAMTGCGVEKGRVAYVCQFLRQSNNVGVVDLSAQECALTYVLYRIRNSGIEILCNRLSLPVQEYSERVVADML